MSDDLASYDYVPTPRPVDRVDGGARLRSITDKVCRIGGHPVTREAFEGFSYLGRREFNLSGACEPCFDRAFTDLDDEALGEPDDDRPPPPGSGGTGAK